jgi:hypothetical protein
VYLLALAVIHVLSPRMEAVRLRGEQLVSNLERPV